MGLHSASPLLTEGPRPLMVTLCEGGQLRGGSRGPACSNVIIMDSELRGHAWTAMDELWESPLAPP